MSDLPVQPTKYVITESEPIMHRRAQNLDPKLSQALLRACRASPEVSACYVLDVKKPDSDDMALFVAVTMDDEKRDIDPVGQRFWSEIRNFPERADRIFVLSARKYAEQYRGFEFYRKGEPNHAVERTASQPTGRVGFFERLRRLARGRSL